MATYVIGDIHGCYEQLQALLTKINFDKSCDILWFTGDLINGGPKPAEVIRFIKSLGNRGVCVLGNHDLVLLALAAGVTTPRNNRAIGFEPFFTAPDHEELIAWLRMQSFVHYDATHNAVLVHAGVLANWSLQEILAYAQEVAEILHSDQYKTLYANMLGNKPEEWSPSLTGWDRIRFFINCFTRMRFCTKDGTLDLVTKGKVTAAKPGFAAWFQYPRQDSVKVIFGHWAALMGTTDQPNIIAMDTGCVWGNYLTALCLETGERFSVPFARS